MSIMDLNNFFIRTWESDANCRYASSPTSFKMEEVISYVSEIISIPFQDYLTFIKEDSQTPCVLSSDVPQFSSIDSATSTICNVLSNRPLKGYKFEEIGEMLLPDRQADIVANKKYGENHVKTASDLGLCFCKDGKYYISPIGCIFPQLTQYQRDQLISRLALRNSLVYTAICKVLNGSPFNIVKEISFLSESTVKRRKNNCMIMCNLIRLNRDINVDDIIAKIE